MPLPCSTDLRRRVFEAIDEGMTVTTAARRFKVDRASIYRWRKKLREEGTLEATWRRRGRDPKLKEPEFAVLRELVEEDPNALIPDLVELLAERTGKRVSTSTLSRGLAQAGITRKKRNPRHKRGTKNAAPSSRRGSST